MATQTENSKENKTGTSASSGSYLAETETEQGKKKNILEELFANGNKLLTLPDSDILISDETRRLVALFSDGTFLVSARGAAGSASSAGIASYGLSRVSNAR